AQYLDQEKQKIADLKEQEELFELMKEELTGDVHHDHDVMDRAPPSLYHKLFQYHLYHEWDS
ncbi:unnamed protein product, partial [marine sediment metagenome]